MRRDYVVDGIGLWCQRLTTRMSAGCPALFCDRDGVIVEEVNYLGNPKDVRLISTAASVIRAANRLGVSVVIVTNQSGIGRGYYGWRDFCNVQDRISQELAKVNATIDLVLACAYHREARGEFRLDDHKWRKPNPGMMLEAERLLKVNLTKSLIVGDRLSDLQAGSAAGIGRGLLVRTGYGAEEARRLPHVGLTSMQVDLADDISGAELWLNGLPKIRDE